jgi:hypothetical protein
MAQPLLTTTTHVLNTISCNTPCDFIALTAPSAIEGASDVIGKLVPGNQITFWEVHGTSQSEPMTITMVDPPIAMGTQTLTPSMSGVSVALIVVLVLALVRSRRSLARARA